jgi:hypothetical protein
MSDYSYSDMCEAADDRRDRDWWRKDACRCGSDMPGRCPGPENCPMCEEEGEDAA